VRGLLVLLALVAVIMGLVTLDRALRSELRDDARFRLPFAAIDCAPPEPVARETFLKEVRERSDLPDTVYLLDNDLPRQLAQAFARHPWVSQVERVEILPKRQILVRLRYRRPVLAVEFAGQIRAVDGDGVLLPVEARTEGLPRFGGTPFPPAGPAGTHWNDPAVEEAARKKKERH
jgi:hypothetical protein